MALEPITRKEKIIAGENLEPITRLEKFLKEYGGSGGSGGGGGGVTTLHINVTAVNVETMNATFTADKTPAEMQQASVNGPIWCVVTFAAGVISGEALSLGIPPTWYQFDLVSFGTVTLPAHDKKGDNVITSAVLGIPSSGEWRIDLRTFAGS